MRLFGSETKWELWTTLILFVLCAIWFFYELNGSEQFPFEPLVAFLSYLIGMIGLFLFKKNEDTGQRTITQVAEKIWNIKKIDNAEFNIVVQGGIAIVLVPILSGIIAWLWIQLKDAKEPFNLNVTIENTTPNEQLPKPKGTLTLTYGGDPKPAQNITKSHVFQGIPSKFKTESMRLQYQTDGFVPVDTLISEVEEVRLDVRRNNDFAIAKGRIVEADNTDRGIEDVLVYIECCSTKTDANGRFEMTIPIDEQRLKQHFYFEKEGYNNKNQYEPIIKGESIETPLGREQ